MTEKTPNTSKPAQDGGPAKQPAVASGGTEHDKSKPDSTDKGSASTVHAGASAPAPISVDKKSDAGGVKAPKASDASTPSKAAAKVAGDAVSPKSYASTSSASGSGAGGGSDNRTPSAGPEHHKKPSRLPVVLLSVVAVALAGGVWYQHTVSQDLISRLEAQTRSSAEEIRTATQQAQQALTAVSQQQSTIDALSAELQDSKAELDGLSRAFQTITDRGSDLVLLNDIDHLVMIAQQQLQLNGNVANAIISLETAQAQLARANRPALASLLHTINGDLDRLRAATTVDIALLSTRLDELAGLVTQAPLLVPDGATASAADHDQESAEEQSPRMSDTDVASDIWWKGMLERGQQWTLHTLSSLRYELGQFISIRRVDDAAALLISPDQASRFRDSLRQRIMTAQLALMMDQSLVWETETDSLLQAIESRFDPQSALTRQAVRLAREVADTSIDTPLPDVQNSIKALEAVNEQMGRRSFPEQSPAGGLEQASEDGQAHDGQQADLTETQSGQDAELTDLSQEHVAEPEDSVVDLAEEDTEPSTSEPATNQSDNTVADQDAADTGREDQAETEDQPHTDHAEDESMSSAITWHRQAFTVSTQPDTQG